MFDRRQEPPEGIECWVDPEVAALIESARLFRESQRTPGTGYIPSGEMGRVACGGCDVTSGIPACTLVVSLPTAGLETFIPEGVDGSALQAGRRNVPLAKILPGFPTEMPQQ